MRSSEGWLPNLARGVSVWKLVDDLNDPALFDGRLLEPETEGPDNLPTAVLWDVADLLPYPEARRAHPEAVRRAVMDFHICIERSRPAFEPGQSFDDYRSAFTLPTLETDGGAHYFFSPDDGQLRVIHWGASKRHGAPGATLVLRKLSFPVFTGERPPPPPSTPQSPVTDASPMDAPTPSPTHRAPWWALLAIAIVVGVVGLWLTLDEEPPPSPAPPRTALPSSPPTASSPPPPTPAPTPTQAAPPPDFVPERIYFAIGSATLTPEARSAVERLAAHLVGTNQAALVEGHTDPTGAEADNATLSARRTLAVIGALVERGVSSELRGVGCAARYPTSADPTREASATRRRVEIYLDPRTPRPGCFTVGGR